MAVVIVAVIALMIALPELVFALSFLGIIAALIGIIIGRLPWLRGRKRNAKFGGLMVLLFVASAITGSSQYAAKNPAPAVAETMVISSESPSPTPSEPPSPTAIADFVGQECKGDELVMEQGAEKLYCDASATGVLAWANQDDHDKTILAAKKVAEEKAAKEKVAQEKAAAAKKAQEKAVADKKVAEEKAAEKKATEKAAAKKAEQKAEAKRIAAQEEAARIAEQEAIEEAYEAPAPAPVSAYYANCSEVRSAGAAPIYSVDPGYSRKLDRDGDGVACE
ncbi:excalibur calcium-binding domain-containing protein [Arthrobacter sp. MYb213]|uniref:excalibur calcium-binding domain-containing protein n=1 Tax=Arthrobacter sp. MYb213 TaxID=1848595 RepID=UPI002570E970|nr:excalibur calcium-binding domain-containing protein [Arthrobacter sp. MYb213]